MPHFYFDIVNDHPIHDKHGVRLPDVAAARSHAQKMADQLTKDRGLFEGGFSKIIVKNGKFEIVLAVPVRRGN